MMEEDGSFEACIVVNGSNRDNIATINIKLDEGTAREGEGRC